MSTKFPRIWVWGFGHGLGRGGACRRFPPWRGWPHGRHSATHESSHGTCRNTPRWSRPLRRNPREGGQHTLRSDRGGFAWWFFRRGGLGEDSGETTTARSRLSRGRGSPPGLFPVQETVASDPPEDEIMSLHTTGPTRRGILAHDGFSGQGRLREPTEEGRIPSAARLGHPRPSKTARFWSVELRPSLAILPPAALLPSKNLHMSFGCYDARYKYGVLACACVRYS